MTTARSSPKLAGLWFGVALYLNSALLLFATPVFTRLMTPAQYGEVSLYNSLVIVLGTFATLSLYAGLFDRAILEHKNKIYDHVAKMMGLIITATLILGGLVWMSVQLLGNFTGVSVTLLAFMLVYFVTNSSFMFWRSIERFDYRYKAVSAVSISASLIGVFGAIVALNIKPNGPYQAEIRVMVANAPLMLAGVWLTWQLRRKAHVDWFKVPDWLPTLALALPLIPHYLAQSLLQQFDRFAISGIVDNTTVGYYGLACALASGHTLLWTAINTTWTPWLYRAVDSGSFTEIRAKSNEIVGLIAATAIIGALITPELVALAAHASYSSAVSYLPYLLLASYFQYCQQNYLAIQFYQKKTRAIAVVSVFAGVLNVGLNLWCITRFGPVSAAIVSTVCHLLQLCLHKYFSKAHGEKDPFDQKVLGLVSLLTAVSIVFLTNVNAGIVVRWCIALALAILIVLRLWSVLRRKS